MHILIPVSPGELVDKITILEIKRSQFTDQSKIIHVEHEYKILTDILEKEVVSSDMLKVLHARLLVVNKKIWDTENDVREFWGDDKKFLKASRNSHSENDERARLKRSINELLGSTIQEEKSHPEYTTSSEIL